MSATGRALGRETIAERAYLIWEAEGRPNGRAVEHWLLAERQLQVSDEPASTIDLGERGPPPLGQASELGPTACDAYGEDPICPAGCSPGSKAGRRRWRRRTAVVVTDPSSPRRAANAAAADSNTCRESAAASPTQLR